MNRVNCQLFGLKEVATARLAPCFVLMYVWVLLGCNLVGVNMQIWLFRKITELNYIDGLLW